MIPLWGLRLEREAMVRHVFLWKVAPEADPDEVFEILEALPENVPGIRRWSMGRHSGSPGASGGIWDYGLVCDFDSFDALQAYSEHPFHQGVIERLLPLCSDRAVCDFEFSG